MSKTGKESTPERPDRQAHAADEARPQAELDWAAAGPGPRLAGGADSTEAQATVLRRLDRRQRPGYLLQVQRAQGNRHAAELVQRYRQEGAAVVQRENGDEEEQPAADEEQRARVTALLRLVAGVIADHQSREGEPISVQRIVAAIFRAFTRQRVDLRTGASVMLAAEAVREQFDDEVMVAFLQEIEAPLLRRFQAGRGRTGQLGIQGSIGALGALGAPLAPLITGAGRTADFAVAIVRGFVTGLGDRLSEADRQELAGKFAAFSLINMVFPLPFLAGAVKEIVADAVGTVGDIIDLVSNLDQVVENALLLAEAILSPEGAQVAEELGRRMGRETAEREIRPALDDNPIGFAYRMGEWFGPTVFYTALAFATGGAAAVYAAASRLSAIVRWLVNRIRTLPAVARAIGRLRALRRRRRGRGGGDGDDGGPPRLPATTPSFEQTVRRLLADHDGRLSRSNAEQALEPPGHMRGADPQVGAPGAAGADITFQLGHVRFFREVKTFTGEMLGNFNNEMRHAVRQLAGRNGDILVQVPEGTEPMRQLARLAGVLRREPTQVRGLFRNYHVTFVDPEGHTILDVLPGGEIWHSFPLEL